MLLEQYLQEDRDFVSLSEEEKTNTLINLSSDGNMLFEYLKDKPDFQELDVEQRLNVLDNMMLDKDITALHQRKGLSMAEQPGYFDWFKSVGQMAVGGVEQAMGGTAEALFGTSEVTEAFRLSSMAKMREASKVREQLGMVSGFVHDVSTQLAMQGPGVAASMITANPIPALAQLGALSFGSKFSETLGAGYSEGAAWGRGVTSTAAEVTFGAITLGQLLNMKRSSVAYVLNSMMTSAVSNATAETAQVARDMVIDAFNNGDYEMLGPPSTTVSEAITNLAKTFGSTAATSAGTGLFYSTAATASMKAKGLTPRIFKDATGTNRAVVVPNNMNGDFTNSMMSMMSTREFNSDQEAQSAVNDTIELASYVVAEATTINTADEAKTILDNVAVEKDNFSQALESFMQDDSTTMEEYNEKVEQQSNQQMPTAKARRLPSSVALDPEGKRVKQVAGIKANVPLEGTLIKRRDGHGQVSLDFKFSDKYEMADELRVIPNIELSELHPSQIAWAATNYHLGRESVGALTFINKLISPDKPISEMSLDEMYQSVSNLMRTAPEIKTGTGKAWGSYSLGGIKGQRELITIVQDLAATDPRFAAKTIAHEIGHFLHLTEVVSDIAKNGMGQIMSIDATMAEVVAQNPQLFGDDYSKRVRQKAAQPLERMAILQEIFGDELDAVSNAWSLMRKPDPDFREKVADFMSVLINDPRNEDGTPIVDLETLAPNMMKVWRETLVQNPSMQAAWTEITQNFNIDEAISDMFKKSSLVKEYARLKKESPQDYAAWFRTTFFDENMELFRAARAAGLAQIDIINFQNDIDRDGHMAEEARYNYLNPIQDEVLSPLKTSNNRLTDKLNLYAFYSSILHDRQRDQVFTSTDFKKRLGAVQQIIEEQLKLNGTTDETVDEMMIELTGDADKYIKLKAKLEAEGNSPRRVQAALQDQLTKNYSIIRTVDLLNPRGVTREQAQKALDRKLDMTDHDFETVQRAFENFSQIRRDWLTKHLNSQDGAVVPSSFKDRVLSNENYVRYSVTKHYARQGIGEGSGTASVMKSRQGTLSDIESVIAATMESDTTFVRQLRQNQLKSDFIEFVRKIGIPNTIRLMSSANSAINNKQEAKVSVRSLQGDVLHYAVDKRLAAGFHHDQTLADLYKHANFFASLGMPNIGPMMRRMFTTHNPVFWVNNLFRDMKRSMVNLPGYAVYYKLPYFWAKGLTEAWRSLTDTPENIPTVKEMTDQGLLASPNMYIHQEYGLEVSAEDRTMFNKTQRLDVLDSDTNAFNSVANLANGIVKFWDRFGMASERATKMGVYKYLNELVDIGIHNGGIDKASRDFMLRRSAGTPILTAKGSASPLMSNLLFFYNPRVQGLFGDMATLRMAHQRGDWSVVVKRIVGATFSRGLTTLALMGAFGPDIKELYDRIPSYHLMRGGIIPIGLTADNKAAYIVTPEDPLTSTMGSMVMGAMLLSKDEAEDSTSVGDYFSNIARGAYNEIPAVSPILTMAHQLMRVYADAGMPMDIGNRPIIPQHISDRGRYDPEFMRAFMKHSWNMLGGATVYRFPYPKQTLGFDPHVEPTTTKQHVLDFIQKGHDIPVIQAFANRLIVTDAGLYENTARTEKGRKMQKARQVGDSVKALREVVGGHAARGELMNAERWQDAFSVVVNKIEKGELSPENADTVVGFLRDRVRDHAYYGQDPRFAQLIKMSRYATGEHKVQLLKQMDELLQQK